MKRVALGSLLAIIPSIAVADSCSTFNMLRFDPAELERCINDLKFSHSIEQLQRNTELDSLRLDICEIVVALADTKPKLNEVIQRTCVPLWEEAKRRRAKRTKAPVK